MGKVLLATVSDGRPAVYSRLEDSDRASQDRLADALRAKGHEVEAFGEVVGANEAAVAAGRASAASRPDLTLVNIPVWSFPNLTLLIATGAAGPLALSSSLDPAYPGVVGMLAAGGALEQIGRTHLRAWGDAPDPAAVG